MGTLALCNPVCVFIVLVLVCRVVGRCQAFLMVLKNTFEVHILMDCVHKLNIELHFKIVLSVYSDACHFGNWFVAFFSCETQYIGLHTYL